MAIAACSSGGCGSSRANAKTKIDSGILQQHRFKVFKFTFCKYFFKGKCTRGNGCTFAHGVEELRERPQLSKTRICEKWRQGTCEHVNSENCRFAHGKEDLRIAKPGICDLHRQGKLHARVFQRHLAIEDAQEIP
ncbi:zinc finger (CCCH type) motif-containing protein [Besnoitia besnoiti]|uniref:Zinc finger (CCCH type) motif-containing protein n=1 Tax=Besnoitia besnoiti TaxID=94643 RepID=A0A2A9M8T7_BESBE|nr:zinc finger (CCCH type) motif-containing protein [Besnoitia besnoiti]PFH34319.1 zinc finger (CCCH type) motif-containing protein [Besnoitia besnoiti]